VFKISDTTDKKLKPIIHQKIKSMVFMGMGEPMNNLSNVLKSIEYIHNRYDYPYNKITISTSGNINGMKKIMNLNPKINLALSLHSPDQKIRDLLIPNLKDTSIQELIKTCNEYNKIYKQKIMIEYLMIKDLTDRNEDINNLINLGLTKMTNFNLIPMNANMTIDDRTFQPAELERCEYFKHILREAGYKCFIRKNMGNDIEAACGMLK